MKMLMNVTFPVQEFNQAVQDGSAGAKLGRIMEEIRPEAIYFTENGGSRGATVIVDVKGESDIPRFCEPWFLTFNASIDIRICMTPEDLKTANLDRYKGYSG